MKISTKEMYHRMIRDNKNKHLDSMACGAKKPDDKARERFRRPAYSGLFSSSKSSGGEE